MGPRNAAQRSVDNSGGRLVVFDLDGTITRSDTLLPYVWGYIKHRPGRIPGLLRVLPTLIGFILGLRDHGQVKSAFIQSTLRGCTRAQLEEWTARFVPDVLANRVFPAALEAIAAHRSEGAHLVLMSASTDLYVPAIAKALGFADVICTGVRWDAERLNGALTTPNRRGAEKVRCFESLRERHAGLPTAAYGNAGSDLAHLRLADQGYLINGSAHSRTLAERDGVSCLTWR